MERSTPEDPGTRIIRVYDEIGARFEGVTEAGYANPLLDRPMLMRLIRGDATQGTSVLDLGCGGGRYVGELLKSGAKVMGVDPSRALLEEARNSFPAATFYVGRAEEIPLPDASFDLVVSGLAFGHVKDLDGAFGEVRRVLKKDGVFVFSRHNPVTEVTVKSQGRYEFDGYFNQRWLTSTWKSFGVEMPHYHHTMETIVTSLLGAGFQIDGYADSEPGNDLRSRFPEAYEKERNRPHFCAFRVKKP